VVKGRMLGQGKAAERRSLVDSYDDSWLKKLGPSLALTQPIVGAISAKGVRDQKRKATWIYYDPTKVAKGTCIPSLDGTVTPGYPSVRARCLWSLDDVWPSVSGGPLAMQ